MQHAQAPESARPIDTMPMSASHLRETTVAL